MSDDFSEVVKNSGWFFSALTGVWAMMLRWIIGRHIKQFDALDEKLDNIDGRLSVIEGRMDERDHYRSGHSTWPGDSR